MPDRPLFSFPFFRSCIARLTFLAAALPYLAIVLLLQNCASGDVDLYGQSLNVSGATFKSYKRMAIPNPQWFSFSDVCT